MIAEIGIMVGLYVVTRMLMALVGPGRGPAQVVIISVPALVTLVVSGFVIFDLLTRGASAFPQ